MKNDKMQENIQIWKIRRLVKCLDSAKGAGTSMISIAIPAKGQISHMSAMLTQEYGTASNIKSSINRRSVLSAITSTQQRLKLYPRVPPNGLFVYAGTICTDEGKEKRIAFDFEPHKPINRSRYVCDDKFHTEDLSALLMCESMFGFIVMDGNGTLFGTVAGNTRDIIHRFTVDLPKKHSHGGQSALRFSRLRDEKRHNYIRKVAEMAVQHFITNDKLNVTGLVLAGSADFQTELGQSGLFDRRLAVKVVKMVDVSYGGENGFNQAIDLAAESLANVKFVQEKRLIQRYFDEISQDTGKYCFGTDDSLKALELGAVETLIVWENLEVMRYVLRSSVGDEIVVHSTQDRVKCQGSFVDKRTGPRMEQVEEPRLLLEWLAERCHTFGATLELVTNQSQEGVQFCKGFGGIGGLLRYTVDFSTTDEDEFYSDDEDF